MNIEWQEVLINTSDKILHCMGYTETIKLNNDTVIDVAYIPYNNRYNIIEVSTGTTILYNKFFNNLIDAHNAITTPEMTKLIIEALKSPWAIENKLRIDKHRNGENIS